MKQKVSNNVSDNKVNLNNISRMSTESVNIPNYRNYEQDKGYSQQKQYTQAFQNQNLNESIRNDRSLVNEQNQFSNINQSRVHEQKESEKSVQFPNSSIRNTMYQDIINNKNCISSIRKYSPECRNNNDGKNNQQLYSLDEQNNSSQKVNFPSLQKENTDRQLFILGKIKHNNFSKRNSIRVKKNDYLFSQNNTSYSQESNIPILQNKQQQISQQPQNQKPQQIQLQEYIPCIQYQNGQLIQQNSLIYTKQQPNPQQQNSQKQQEYQQISTKLPKQMPSDYQTTTKGGQIVQQQLQKSSLNQIMKQIVKSSLKNKFVCEQIGPQSDLIGKIIAKGLFIDNRKQNINQNYNSNQKNNQNLPSKDQQEKSVIQPLKQQQVRSISQNSRPIKLRNQNSLKNLNETNIDVFDANTQDYFSTKQQKENNLDESNLEILEQSQEKQQLRQSKLLNAISSMNDEKQKPGIKIKKQKQEDLQQQQIQQIDRRRTSQSPSKTINQNSRKIRSQLQRNSSQLDDSDTFTVISETTPIKKDKNQQIITIQKQILSNKLQSFQDNREQFPKNQIQQQQLSINQNLIPLESNQSKQIDNKSSEQSLNQQQKVVEEQQQQNSQLIDNCEQQLQDNLEQKQIEDQQKIMEQQSNRTYCIINLLNCVELKVLYSKQKQSYNKKALIIHFENVFILSSNQYFWENNPNSGYLNTNDSNSNIGNPYNQNGNTQYSINNQNNNNQIQIKDTYFTRFRNDLKKFMFNLSKKYSVFLIFQSKKRSKDLFHYLLKMNYSFDGAYQMEELNQNKGDQFGITPLSVNYNQIINDFYKHKKPLTFTIIDSISSEFQVPQSNNFLDPTTQHNTLYVDSNNLNYFIYKIPKVNISQHKIRVIFLKNKLLSPKYLDCQHLNDLIIQGEQKNVLKNQFITSHYLKLNNIVQQSISNNQQKDKIYKYFNEVDKIKQINKISSRIKNEVESDKKLELFRNSMVEHIKAFKNSEKIQQLHSIIGDLVVRNRDMFKFYYKDKFYSKPYHGINITNITKLNKMHSPCQQINLTINILEESDSLKETNFQNNQISNEPYTKMECLLNLEEEQNKDNQKEKKLSSSFQQFDLCIFFILSSETWKV